MSPLISFLSFFMRGFSILVASAEELNGAVWARRAGFIWTGFGALYVLLIPAYLYKGMGIGVLLGHGALALAIAIACFAFSRACAWRSEIKKPL